MARFRLWKRLWTWGRNLEWVASLAEYLLRAVVWLRGWVAPIWISVWGTMTAALAALVDLAPFVPAFVVVTASGLLLYVPMAAWLSWRQRYQFSELKASLDLDAEASIRGLQALSPGRLSEAGQSAEPVDISDELRTVDDRRKKLEQWERFVESADLSVIHPLFGSAAIVYEPEWAEMRPHLTKEAISAVVSRNPFLALPDSHPRRLLQRDLALLERRWLSTTPSASGTAELPHPESEGEDPGK